MERRNLKKMLHSTSPVQMKTSNEASWSNIIESLFNFQKIAPPRTNYKTKELDGASYHIFISYIYKYTKNILKTKILINFFWSSSTNFAITTITTRLDIIFCMGL